MSILLLGLHIVGENVHFDQEPESHTKRLLEGKELTVKTVFEQLVQLHREDDVEDFCRLYILLGLAEFYFPNTKATVHGGFLKLLDDINSLGKYNWGVAVYDFLVNSLTRASISLWEEKNSSQLYITGCAVVLQVCCFLSIIFSNSMIHNVQCVHILNSSDFDYIY